MMSGDDQPLNFNPNEVIEFAGKISHYSDGKEGLTTQLVGSIDYLPVAPKQGGLSQLGQMQSVCRWQFPVVFYDGLKEISGI